MRPELTSVWKLCRLGLIKPGLMKIKVCKGNLMSMQSLMLHQIRTFQFNKNPLY